MELEEELKVTNDICKALEIDFEEREELEAIRQRDNDKYVIVMEDDEADLVEDKTTGHLHPTKVAKVVDGTNSCKKCDIIITNKEDFIKHMKSHTRKCDFECHEGNELLNHVSEVHVKFQKCRTCSRTFVNNEELIIHLVKEHSYMAGNSSDKCAVCGEEFLTVETLIHHILRIHHLVNEDTLATTEAGAQLERVWPTPSAAGFKCYDCGKDVGERANLMKHKTEDHYKQKLCKNFQENNYCRFSAPDCVYIHRPQERQWQSRGNRQAREVQGNRQLGGGDGNVACKNGPDCYCLANNRCRFRHESAPAQSVATPQIPSVVNATPSYSQTVSSGTTMEACIKAVMDRLEQLELRMTPVRNLAGFPPMEGGKKSQ